MLDPSEYTPIPVLVPESPTVTVPSTVPVEPLVNIAIPPLLDFISPLLAFVKVPFSEYNPTFPPASTDTTPAFVNVPVFCTTAWYAAFEIVAPFLFVATDPFERYNPIESVPVDVTSIFFSFSNVELFKITPYTLFPVTVIVPWFPVVPVVPLKYIPIFSFAPFTLILPSLTNFAELE